MNGFSSYLRKFILALGALLLIAGWGMTRWADTQVAAAAAGKPDGMHVLTGEKMKPGAYVGRKDFLSSKELYIYGVSGMGIGAVILIFMAPRGGFHG